MDGRDAVRRGAKETLEREMSRCCYFGDCVLGYCDCVRSGLLETVTTEEDHLLSPAYLSFFSFLLIIPLTQSLLLTLVIASTCGTLTRYQSVSLCLAYVL